jgi:hypothetical protein
VPLLLRRLSTVFVMFVMFVGMLVSAIVVV